MLSDEIRPNTREDPSALPWKALISPDGMLSFELNSIATLAQKLRGKCRLGQKNNPCNRVIKAGNKQ